MATEGSLRWGSGDGRMRNVVEQAHRMYEGEVGFLRWLQRRVAQADVPTLEVYGPDAVFRRLLGRSVRIYQVWEQKKSYPVREPVRRARYGAPSGRVYSPTQVVQIAWWFWETGRVDETRGKKRGG